MRKCLVAVLKGMVMENYYAIQVVTGQEQKIKKLFAKCYSSYLLSKQANLLVPQHLVHRKVRHRYKNVWMTQWPGYIILKCPNLDHELYYLLKRFNGVIRVFENNIPIDQISSYCGGVCSQFKKRLELTKKLLQRKSSYACTFIKKFKRHRVVGVCFSSPWKGLTTNRSAPLLN